MSGPRTEAGKRLAAQTLGLRNRPEDILAIEHEAVATALAKASVAVRRLRRDRGDEAWDTVVRSEVLAALALAASDEAVRR